MTQRLEFNLKWPQKQVSDACILYPSKSSSNVHVNQDLGETSGTARILTYFGDQKDMKIEPLRSIFCTPLTLSPMSI